MPIALEENLKPKIAIVSRDNPLPLDAGRFRAIAAALDAAGFRPIACHYDEAREAEVEAELRGCAAALVWVNPVQDGRFRHGLDRVLRRAAEAGVMVSAHPDVIDRMGVKAVLAVTAEIGWSGDARYYATAASLEHGLAATLGGGPRVLKQNRGHSGIGVWRVEMLSPGQVRVMEARDRTRATVFALADFLAERAAELDQVGGFVDQAFQPLLADGMVRCYLAGARLAGFGWQKVRALLDADDLPTPPRSYSGPDDPRFQLLRRLMDQRWTPALIRVLGLGEGDLPALWDADFLFGPRDAQGQDSFVLCEINVSSVSPMPDEAPAAVAALVARRLAERRHPPR